MLFYIILPNYLYPIIGTKSAVTWFKSNLIIVSPPASQPARLTATTRNGLSLQSNNTSQISVPFELTKVTIFDTANKFIAYMGTFSHGVRTICCEWGGIYILGMDGKVIFKFFTITLLTCIMQKINQ